MALHGRNAVRPGFGLAARSDQKLEPVRGVDSFAERDNVRSDIEELNAILFLAEGYDAKET
jgi:hypothetical protein